MDSKGDALTPERSNVMEDRRMTVIEAGRANREYFKDLWRFRELF